MLNQRLVELYGIEGVSGAAIRKVPRPQPPPPSVPAKVQLQWLKARVEFSFVWKVDEAIVLFFGE